MVLRECWRKAGTQDQALQWRLKRMHNFQKMLASMRMWMCERESLSCMVSLKVGWFLLLFVLVLLQGRFAVRNFLLLAAAVAVSLFIF
jgi:hypothetical protein